MKFSTAVARMLICKLLAMPGFRTVQRLKAIGPARSPYLAVHGIDSAGVFTTPEYLAGGGRSAPGEWTTMMVDWHRNLFDGVDAAPPVSTDSVLVLVDRLIGEVTPLPAGLIALDCVGLDRTVHQRGLAVCGDGAPLIVKQALPLPA